MKLMLMLLFVSSGVFAQNVLDEFSLQLKKAQCSDKLTHNLSRSYTTFKQMSDRVAKRDISYERIINFLNDNQTVTYLAEQAQVRAESNSSSALVNGRELSSKHALRDVCTSNTINLKLDHRDSVLIRKHCLDLNRFSGPLSFNESGKILYLAPTLTLENKNPNQKYLGTSSITSDEYEFNFIYDFQKSKELKPYSGEDKNRMFYGLHSINPGEVGELLKKYFDRDELFWSHKVSVKTDTEIVEGVERITKIRDHKIDQQHQVLGHKISHENDISLVAKKACHKIYEGYNADAKLAQKEHENRGEEATRTVSSTGFSTQKAIND